MAGNEWSLLSCRNKSLVNKTLPPVCHGIELLLLCWLHAYSMYARTYILLHTFARPRAPHSRITHAFRSINQTPGSVNSSRDVQRFHFFETWSSLVVVVIFRSNDFLGTMWSTMEYYYRLHLANFFFGSEIFLENSGFYLTPCADHK